MRKTFSLPVAATAAGGGPTPPPPADTVDNIEHSVRLNSADFAQFTKTFSSAGNTKTNTISLWVKRNKISYAQNTYQSFLSANNNFIWHFDTTDRLGLYQGGFIRYTTQKFRDPSAWYHFVFATDTTQSAASDQIKVYVNGQLITDWDTETALTQNTVLNWNSNVQHCIGSNNNNQFPDIQIADVQSIDGLQLTASSFGFTDSNGVWQPKAYTGDYGTEDYPGATTDSSGSFYAGRGPENLFDGSTTTLCDPALQSGVITFTPTTGIPYSSSVEVYTAYDVEISLNGGAAVTASATGWTTVDSGSGTISSLSVTIPGFRPNWRAIRVDGKILINSPNGFHLDFADTSSATALGNDVSGNNNDWTPSGLVAGPAYTANSFSTEFDGTGDYLTVPSSPNWTLGASGDFTVEAWVYPNSSHNSGILTTFTSWSTGFVNKWAFALAGTTLRWYLDNGGVGLTAILSMGQWSHIAASRSGSTIYLFVNGNLAGTQTANQDYSSQDRLIIGSAPGFGDFNGKISNVRIIKGRALYTAAFTPPSTALTATDDTVLLTCQDATVRDNSNIGHSVTASGDVAVVNEGPFNGYSGDFSSGGSLSIADSTDFTLGTNDFTLEAWCYFTSTSFQLFLGQNDGNVSGSSIDVRYSAGTVTTYAFSGGNSYSATGSAAANVWNHVAWVRDGSTLRLFINGSQTNTSNIGTNSINDSGTIFRIGNNASKFSNVRLTNGQALYTADFTPPTADLTTTSQGATASNVKILTCQNSTFIDNSPSAHTITVNGSAHTVSVNPHTDKYSVTFDGTGDYLITPQSSDWLYTGDYTIEFWLYQSVNQEWCVYDTGGAGSADQFVHIGGTVYWGYGTTDSVTGSFSLGDINQWIHWAVTRSGNVTRMFKNGVVVDTNTAGPAANIGRSNADLWIGARRDPAYYVNGKVSNLRVTNGQALYTSNFLPTKEDLTTTSQGATASNVKLLTCQSYKIQDNSPSAHTITPVNDAAPSTVAPFVTSGAGSFDGNDYLTIANHASDFNLGTDDFTIEFWINSTQTSRADPFAWNYNLSSAGWGSFILNSSAGRIDWYEGTGIATFATSTNWNDGLWHHLAVSRSGTSLKMFLDGVQIGSTATSSYSYGAANSGIQLGFSSSTGYYLTGKMSNFRISKGLARYTSNFTPPTEDFDPTDQDTTFLALQGNNLDDLAGDHAVSALGDAATSTVSPFEPVDGSDAMLDSPTNYGSGDTVRGNYCTWNPLTGSSAFTLTNGNLDVSDSGAASPVLMGTIGVNSGKWYWEVTLGTAAAYVGASQVTSTSSVGFLGATSGQFIYNTNSVSSSWINGSGYNYSTASGATTGDVIGVALNFDSNEITFYKNGVSEGVFGSNVLGTSTWTPAFKSNASTSATFNFGQQPFKYPLAGYKSLCSTNLPTPAVADGSTAMDVKLYTGNNSTQTISGFGFSPDLVWIKSRAAAYAHSVNDTVRGADRQLFTNLTNAEGTVTNQLTSFTSDGFTLGSNSTGTGGVNFGTGGYAAWAWDAGSSTVSNTDGTVTSQVRANPSAGISIATFTGSGAGSFGHGLTKTPAFVISKKTAASGSWNIYHESLGVDQYLAFSTAAAGSSTGFWSGTNSSVVGFSSNNNCSAGANVAYCFAPVEGFSAFGSYTGSTSLPFIYTGFRPRWILFKRTDASNNWFIVDTERDSYNDLESYLSPDLSNAEATAANIADAVSNGFKLRAASNYYGFNATGGTYIYAAFAEHPFKTSRAR